MKDKMVQIHQFHPSVAYGDAVSNSILELKKILNELGYDSEIFVQHIHPRIRNIKKISEYSSYSSPETILILHHSLAYDQDIFNYFKALPDKKILIYHNITPSDFFKNVNDTYEYYSKLGRNQLREFKEIVKIALGDSRYNEEELQKSGFEKTDILPVPISFDKFDIPGNSEIIQKYSDDWVNILTVARICPNKKIEDIIRTFYYYKKAINPKSRLFLVGSTEGMDNYYSQLKDLVEKLQITDVFFTGHLTFEELVSYYRISHIFITLSEHEGFCVPLLESMYFGIPIVAYNSTAIPHTLGNSGILINNKDPLKTAELMNLLINEPTLRKKIVQTQKKRLQMFDRQRIKEKISSILVSVIQNQQKNDLLYQIEGPFDSSYSLALINREMARALNTLHPDKVALYSTEGPGDYEPDATFLAQNPEVDKLWKKSKRGYRPYVVTRNLYPPRVSGMTGSLNILNDYGWEESAFPEKYVLDFNRSLNGITVMSGYVKKVLIDNGVCVPIKAIGVGVDHVCKITPKQIRKNFGTKFKFLHISSGFPRKSIDILLEAYSDAFSHKDNVNLIIKTFPNIHNTVEKQIQEIQLKNPDCAEITLINEDLDYEFLIDLYRQSNALVAPSRGEGFGLPIAEAMIFGVPVITTGFGGQCDFCNEGNAWLINYTFKRAETHMQLDDSVWVEPDVHHLSKIMREFVDQPEYIITEKTENAKKAIHEHYTWISCAKRLDSFVDNLKTHRIPETKQIRLGWISSWNTKCGIATYSQYLLQHLDKKQFSLSIFGSTKDCLNSTGSDDLKVIRCWKDCNYEDLSQLMNEIKKNKIEHLVIQFNFSFFNLRSFSHMIDLLHNNKIKIYIFLHSTKDVDLPDFKVSIQAIAQSLKNVERIFVHSISDLNELKKYDLIHNVILFPHGVVDNPPYNQSEIKEQLGLSGRIIISSYGFLLRHKGIIELIMAFKKITEKIPHIHLFLINSLYPDEDSVKLRDECRNLITRLNLVHQVTMITDYLTDDECQYLLGCSDIIVFPYQKTQESSSAAIRAGLSARRPVVCTNLPIFEDVSKIVHFLPGTEPDDIAQGLMDLLDKKDILNSKVDLQNQWIKTHSWISLTRRLENIIKFFTLDCC